MQNPNEKLARKVCWGFGNGWKKCWISGDDLTQEWRLGDWICMSCFPSNYDYLMHEFKVYTHALHKFLGHENQTTNMLTGFCINSEYQVAFENFNFIFQEPRALVCEHQGRGRVVKSVLFTDLHSAACLLNRLVKSICVLCVCVCVQLDGNNI